MSQQGRAGLSCCCEAKLAPFSDVLEFPVPSPGPLVAFGIDTIFSNIVSMLSGLNTFTSFHVPLSHDPPGGGVRARVHLCPTEGKPATKLKRRSANLKVSLEATTSNV